MENIFELKRKDMNLIILSVLPIFMILLSFIMDTPKNIIKGLLKIVTNPDVLLQDYIAIGGIGGTLLNSGLLALICLTIVYFLNAEVNNTIISSILTITGFAFMGKNILNVWPIFLGGYLYALATKTKLKDIVGIIFFATTLAPVVSMTIFGFGLPLYIGIPFGTLLGVTVGFVIVPLSKHLIHTHSGYNIYNIGFVGGLIGIALASILRAFNLDPITMYKVTSEYSNFLRILLIVFFLFLILVGYIKNGNSFKGYSNVFKYSGRLLTTFIEELGYGIAYINIGIMGFICIAYVSFVGGNFNGPVMAAILTCAGFSPSGKNPKNVLPILVGVYITTFLNSFDVASTNIVIAALFAMTLAPIAGVYGFVPGVIAGILHLCISPNLSSVHAGLHLYNNGFSGGIVAMIMAPLLEIFFKKKENII